MRGRTVDGGRVKVIEVKRYSPAQQAGLKEGDVVAGAETALFSTSTEPSLTTLNQLLHNCQVKANGITLLLELRKSRAVPGGPLVSRKKAAEKRRRDCSQAQDRRDSLASSPGRRSAHLAEDLQRKHQSREVETPKERSRRLSLASENVNRRRSLETPEESTKRLRASSQRNSAGRARESVGARLARQAQDREAHSQAYQAKTPVERQGYSSQVMETRRERLQDETPFEARLRQLRRQVRYHMCKSRANGGASLGQAEQDAVDRLAAAVECFENLSNVRDHDKRVQAMHDYYSKRYLSYVRRRELMVSLNYYYLFQLPRGQTHCGG